nr:MAG TPA: hypothetical protein [Caudoviricetes sp.]
MLFHTRGGILYFFNSTHAPPLSKNFYKIFYILFLKYV